MDNGRFCLCPNRRRIARYNATKVWRRKGDGMPKALDAMRRTGGNYTGLSQLTNRDHPTQGFQAAPYPWSHSRRHRESWECKTDPVRFKWGFGEGRLKDKFLYCPPGTRYILNFEKVKQCNGDVNVTKLNSKTEFPVTFTSFFLLPSKGWGFFVPFHSRMSRGSSLHPGGHFL